jgi:hypothetical protein
LRCFGKPDEIEIRRFAKKSGQLEAPGVDERQDTKSPRKTPRGTMNKPIAKYLPWALAVIAISLCALSAARYWLLDLRVYLAAEQIEVFRDMATSAEQTSNPREVSGLLKYAIDYYPSGTKQPAGTPLDGIVEEERKMICGRIVDRLRSLTGRDLGKDPKEWLRAYPPAL